MDYVKKVESRAKVYIGISMFISFIYCLYMIPMETIVMTIIVGIEALAFFGIRKKKTIPIYLHIGLAILLSILMLFGSSLEIYDYATKEQIDGVDYTKIFSVLPPLVAFCMYLDKAKTAIKAVEMIKEEQNVMVPLLTNPVWKAFTLGLAKQDI